MLVKDIVDNIISHNEIVAIHVERREEISYHECLWRGMAWQIPEKFANMTFSKIFGVIPETIDQADTINIEVK